MADAFDKIKSSFNKGINTINVKAASLAEKAKIKAQIDATNNEIKRMYTEAGQAAYEQWKSHSEDNSKVLILFNQIQDKQDNIAMMNDQMAAIDERDNEMLGNKAEYTPGNSGLICPCCGAGYDTPVKFCRSCGCRMTE